MVAIFFGVLIGLGMCEKLIFGWFQDLYLGHLADEVGWQSSEECPPLLTRRIHF